MGGKGNPKRRTKNNTQPASSSRALEQFGDQLPTVVNIFPFGCFGSLFGASIMECPQWEIKMKLTSQFHAIFKKFTKKDPLSRRKALSEFNELIMNSELDDVKSILPLWPSAYINLANDIDPHVRQFAQSSLRMLVSKCQKNMAPYLKYIVPTWLCSRFDNNTSASMIASNCFDETFTNKASSRAGDVCLHCQENIMQHVIRTLLRTTPQMLLESNVQDLTEAERMYERMVACSINVLNYFLKSVVNCDANKITCDPFQILQETTFWNFSQSKVISIRSAWCDLWNTLLKYYVEKVDLFKERLIKYAFHNIGETNITYIWNMIILLQKRYKDWYKIVDFQKSVSPKVSSLLTNNFHRNANGICPVLLPFISNISQCSSELFANTSDYSDWINNFFKDFLTALQYDKKSFIYGENCNETMILKAYYDCLRFFIQPDYSDDGSEHNSKENEIEEDFILDVLVDKYLISVLNWLFSRPNDKLSNFGFKQVSFMMAFYYKQCANKPLYAKILTHIVEGVFSFLIEIFIVSVSCPITEMERLTDFMCTIYLTTDDVRMDQKEEALIYKDKDLSEFTDTINEMRRICYLDLKCITIQLIRFFLKEALKSGQMQCISYVYTLSHLLDEDSLYAYFTPDGTATDTLDCLIRIVKDNGCNDWCQINVWINLIYDILQCNISLLEPALFQEILQCAPDDNAKSLIVDKLFTCYEFDRKVVNDVIDSEYMCKVAGDLTKTAIASNSEELFHIVNKCIIEIQDNQITPHKSLAVVLEDLIMGISTLITDNDHDYTDEINTSSLQLSNIFRSICSSKDTIDTDLLEGVFYSLFYLSCHSQLTNTMNDKKSSIITEDWKYGLKTGKIYFGEDCLLCCVDIINICIDTSNYIDGDEVEPIYMFSVNSLSNFMVETVTFFMPYISKNEPEKYGTIDTLIENILFLRDSAAVRLYEVTNFVEAIYMDSIPISKFINRDLDCEKFYSIWKRVLINIYMYDSFLKLFTDKEEIIGTDEAAVDKCIDDLCNTYIIKDLTIYIEIAAATNALLDIEMQWDLETKMLAQTMVENTAIFLRRSERLTKKLKEKLIQIVCVTQRSASCRALSFLLLMSQNRDLGNNGALVFADVHNLFVKSKNIKAYASTLQYLEDRLYLHEVSVPSNFEGDDVWWKAVFYRFSLDTSDDNIPNEKITEMKTFIEQLSNAVIPNKNALAYCCSLLEVDHTTVICAVEQMKFLRRFIIQIPKYLQTTNWTTISMCVSYWLQSVNTSLDQALLNADLGTFYFMIHALRLYHTLKIYFEDASAYPGTQSIEQESYGKFSNDIEITLFKIIHRVAQQKEITLKLESCWITFLFEIQKYLHHCNYTYVYKYYRESKMLCDKALIISIVMCFGSEIHDVRVINYYLFTKLAPCFINKDVETLRNDNKLMSMVKEDALYGASNLDKWHFLHLFENALCEFSRRIHKYLPEFEYKHNDIGTLSIIDENDAFPFLILWGCIIKVYSKAPINFKSIYTNWLLHNNYETLLDFLIRAMPREILRGTVGRRVGTVNFFGRIKHASEMLDHYLTDTDVTINVGNYACYLYVEALCQLPSLVRRWWTNCPGRKKNFIDMLTKCYVAPSVAEREINNISSNIYHHPNINVKSLWSCREIVVTYTFEGARIKLLLTLQCNHPLSIVDVECKNKVGRNSPLLNIARQLAFFLSVQNRSILDGILVWKSNLDKKYEGIDECNICLSVVHHDISNLPKITCRTCKKKFHGPCLYQWFSSSSKPTCPMCRNIF